MVAAGFRVAALALASAACTSIAADARTFEGTRWHVAAINGRATPAQGDYRMEFKGGSASGRFGCNGFGGRYSIASDKLVVREVRSTLMACSDPAGSFESAGSAILNQPMRMRWATSRRVQLVNSAGSIDLTLLP
jgi:heat shock protein HslJ